LDSVVEFKRKVYKQALTELSRLLKTDPCQNTGYDKNNIASETGEVLINHMEVNE